MRVRSLIALVLLLTTALAFAVSCDTADTTDTTDTTNMTLGSAEVDPSTGTPAAEDMVNLMTFNLRYKTTGHPCMSLDVRGPHLMEIVKKYDPDSISFCEATNDWMNYLRREMGKLGYSDVGVGRDSGNTGGSGSGNEHSPIFYKSDKYELVESDTFWLSTTPEAVGSKSWGASMKRICTYAVLKNKETQVMYAHFGTHLDTKNAAVRQGEILVIESYIRQVLNEYGDIGIVLSGDFNDGMESAPYRLVTSFMDDSRTIAKRRLVVGSTMNNYSPDAWESTYGKNKQPVVEFSSPIDYIFLGKNTASVSLYTVVYDYFTFEADGRTWHNHPVSDHYGVFCTASFTAPADTITYDESKQVSYLATLSPSETLPASYEGLSVINDRFKVSSSLTAVSPISNLLKDNSAVSTVSVTGDKHGIWEIELTADKAVGITGISFTTALARRKLPSCVRIFVSNDGLEWRQLGDVYSEALTSSTTYYLTPPAPQLRVRYVKIVFSDCYAVAELANLKIYGE